ncbi:SipW-dependent-type signal peptide-containing protein [Chloroflexota bacterium]
MKQILLALTVVLVVASLAGVGTYASFSDIETSTGNYVETGDLDMQLGDDAPMVTRSDGTIENPSAIPEDFGEDPLGDSVTETWLLPNAQVGDTVDSCVWVRNVGSISGEHLNVYCTIENIDFYGGVSNKDEMLVINDLIYRNGPGIPLVQTTPDGQQYQYPHVADDDGDGRITLHDLALYGIRDLPVPSGDFSRLEMSVTFDVPPGVDPNLYQADETKMTFIFHLE